MRTFRSSRPDRWTLPRRSQFDWERRHHHGPIIPMEQDGLLTRIFRRFA